MKKKLLTIVISLIAGGSLLFQAGCFGGDGGGDDGGGGSGLTFDTASAVGDIVTVTIGSETINMIYANNQASITFPTGSDDTGSATLTKQFFTSETEVTNAVFTEVLQWAYNHSKFTETAGQHNTITSLTAKYGDQILINFDHYLCRINYSGGAFTVDNNYEDHPVVLVSWYGAIMFCKWLTEMRDGDGNTDNAVYTGIDTDWDHTETVEDTDKTGYRLLSEDEWGYAARYIGTTEPTEVNLASEYIAKSVRGGSASLTAGYYWTPAAYASGAIKHAYISGATPETNDTETRLIAWFSGDDDMGGSNKLMPVAEKGKNQIGLYDMSGNASEWCFTNPGGARLYRGGGYMGNSSEMRLYNTIASTPGNMDYKLGFRFCRTRTE